MKLLGDVLFDLKVCLSCKPGDGRVPPMRSALLKYDKLEYFSRLQQEHYPLKLTNQADEVDLIEEIVRVWMHKNRVTDLNQLYESSIIGSEAIWYYDEVDIPAQKDDGEAGSKKESKTDTE